MIGNYPGGKGNTYQQIINLMPPHRIYVEPFLGGGSVMLNKRPAAVNIGLDVDTVVVAEWHAWLRANGRIVIPGDDGPLPGSIARNDEGIRKGGLLWQVEHYGRWQIAQADALQWLTNYTPTGDELIYCDPPYLLETRKSQRPLYRHELNTVAEHEALLAILLALNCRVMISGYYSDLYRQTLAGWHTHTFTAYNRAHDPATEYIWCNFEPSGRLHDYNHLGANFRERERIKRKKARWVNKLQNMDMLERAAILAAIEEVWQA